MKLFGGFGGARSYGTAKKQIKEEKKQSATEDAPRKRTPEELAEIERIIAAYQKKKRKRRLIALAVIVVLALCGFIAWKSIVRPPDIVQPGSGVDHGQIQLESQCAQGLPQLEGELCHRLTVCPDMSGKLRLLIQRETELRTDGPGGSDAGFEVYIILLR